MRLSVGVASILVFASAISARSPEQTKGINERRRQVTVDVVVTDKEGRAVRGLRKSDFRLLENDREEEIDFSGPPEMRNSQPAPVIPENTFTNAFRSNREAVNAIRLDLASTPAKFQELARHELIRYFDSKPQGSYFAVFVFGKGDSICVSCDGLRLLQGVTEDKELLIGALSRLNSQAPLLRMSMNGFEDSSLQPLAEVANYLRDLPGRKEIIWMAGNFDAAPVAERPDIWFPPKFNGWEKMDPLSSTQMLHLTSGRLASARIALYPIDLTGRNKRIESIRQCIHEDQASENGWWPELYECKETGMSLDRMAMHSGGRAFHGPVGILEALTESVSDQNNFYTLSYASSYSKLDGRVRHIKILVNGNGYHLNYRREYFADDPAMLFRDEGMATDLVLPNCRGPIPWKVVRVDNKNAGSTQESIGTYMKYDSAEQNGVIFAVHVDTTGKPVKATAEQMENLENFSFFRMERIREALLAGGTSAISANKKGQFVLDLLPPAEAVYLEPFQIDYLIPARQLHFARDEDGKLRSRIEVAVVAYDEFGRSLAGSKGTTTFTILEAKLEEFLASQYFARHLIEIPERATALRVAVQDEVSGDVGSFEIPLTAITSRHVRRRLKIPDLSDERQQ